MLFYQFSNSTANLRFSLDGKRIQVVRGRDYEGKLIRAWEIKVTIQYPKPQVFSVVKQK